MLAWHKLSMLSKQCPYGHEFFSRFHWCQSVNKHFLKVFLGCDALQEIHTCSPYQLISVQLLSCAWLLATPWTAACQASLSITSSWSLLKLISIESVMPSSHLILCCPLLLLPSIYPNIRAFSNESVLHIKWPKHWSFSFRISPSNEYSGLISFRMNWLDLLQSKGL